MWQINYQIDFRPLVRLWAVKEKATTCFDQMTSHFNIVMGKIEQKLFKTL